MTLRLVPVSFKEANLFVGKYHRHNRPVLTWKFGVGVKERGGEDLVGVAMAGLPKARMLCDGETLEVNRTCTNGTRNVNSMLYGAIARAAKSLGWKRLVTYTLPSESGASLRAVGWKIEAHTEGGANGRTWQEARGSVGSVQKDLFGEDSVPLGPKLRWHREL